MTGLQKVILKSVLPIHSEWMCITQGKLYEECLKDKLMSSKKGPRVVEQQ